ncbi:MAG: PrsW family intramembrane metalloprotease [Acidobacteria bacterium]|nr:PrsW family intramembrane metalloprotease [Acidobacteriota bacterium]
MNETHSGAGAARVGAAGAGAKRRGVLRWALLSCAVLVGLLVGGLILLLIGAGTGPVPFLIGFTLATLPVPVYLSLALWLDRFEAEPKGLLAVAFFWGAIAAIAIALVFGGLAQLFVGLMWNDAAADFSGTVIFAPAVEETAKALVLFGIYYFRRDEFDGVVDGIIYATMVGLGFAMTENIQYYGGAAREGGVGGGLGAYAHPLFTSMTGIGLGLAGHTQNRAVKLLAPPAGLLLAMLLHGLWNLSATIHALAYFAVYFCVMVPVFAAVLFAVYFGLRREGRIVRERLACDLQAGLISAREVELLCSVRGRLGASYAALRRGGLEAWRAQRRLHGVASELAFHRDRVARRARPGDGEDAAREESYRREMSALRARLLAR